MLREGRLGGERVVGVGLRGGIERIVNGGGVVVG
jgi:hypothetical protein